MSTKKQKRERLQKAREETAKREFKYTTAQTLIGIFALALMFFAWGSHLLPVTDPVESNYALTAKEMVLSGNWLSPQIYGHFWFDKPAMVYWLMSNLIQPFRLYRFCLTSPCRLLRGCNDHTSCLVYPPDYEK